MNFNNDIIFRFCTFCWFIVLQHHEHLMLFMLMLCNGKSIEYPGKIFSDICKLVPQILVFFNLSLFKTV